jgi:hypothetical protein
MSFTASTAATQDRRNCMIMVPINPPVPFHALHPTPPNEARVVTSGGGRRGTPAPTGHVASAGDDLVWLAMTRTRPVPDELARLGLIAAGSAAQSARNFGAGRWL